MKQVSVFGNIDYAPDALPIKILPELRNRFAQVRFLVEDPNELGLITEKDWIIIDTVMGIKDVKLLSVDQIRKNAPGLVTVHDFDLASQLLWLKKIQKGIEIKIIGVPPGLPYDEALEKVTAILASLLSKNETRS